MSQKVGQGFGKLWPNKHLNKHFICNKKKHSTTHALYNDSPDTSYFTKLQIQHPTGQQLQIQITLQSKPQTADLSQKYEIQIINNYSIRNFHKR